MAIYALPLTDSSQPPQPRSSILTRRRRKRHRPPTPPPAEYNLDDDAYNIAAGASNPLSLSPDEVQQYRLAGWPLHLLLPDIKNFPHARVPSERKARPPRSLDVHKEPRDDGDTDAEGTGGRSHQSAAASIEDGSRAMRDTGMRRQHLSVLVAIMHRCLGEGDIARATKAFALLLRTHVDGRPIDLRGSGYWGIGAELLLRSHDAKRQESPEPVSSRVDQAPAEDETISALQFQSGERRWGTAAGLVKLRDYYERLVLQYAHSHLTASHGNPTSLDFWPVMLTCEIYGIQFDQKEAMRKADQLNEDLLDDITATAHNIHPTFDEIDDSGQASLWPDAHDGRHPHDRLSQLRWERRELARRTALGAIEQLSARMDSTMAVPPYSESHAMLRLRGMIALYMGDLSVPESLQTVHMHETEAYPIESHAAHRLDQREQMFEHQSGLQRRNEQHLLANTLFDKLRRTGGSLEDVMDVSIRGSSLGRQSMSPHHDHVMLDNSVRIAGQDTNGSPDYYDHYDVS